MNKEIIKRILVGFFCTGFIICFADFNQKIFAELIIHNEFNEIEAPMRILPDNDPSKFWIVSRLEGLYLLTEEQPGLWTIQLAENLDLLDAAGPTADGIIYCTAETDAPQYERYIAVFDCSSNQFIDQIELSTNYPINSIAISDDEMRLYITVSTTNETASSTYLAPENDGRILELDIATESVLRTVPIQPWAHTIYLWEDDAILTSCNYWPYPWDPSDSPEELRSITQVVDVNTFTRIAEIPSGDAQELLTNSFIGWDGSFVVLLNCWLYGDFNDPNFREAIWLINPLTGAVVDTIGVVDEEGVERGVRFAYISEKRDDILYISAGYNITQLFFNFPLLVTDLDGNYLDKAILPEDFLPFFIQETGDGKLIVSGPYYEENGEVTSRVYILEWVNHPPVADLQVVTTMPYLGPSPAAIDFDASCSSDPDPGDILTYEWDFDGDLIFSEPVDDAYIGDPETPTHDYTSTYHGVVFVKVTDLEGAESICTAQVDVEII